MRFVRASKYRHVYGQSAKKELCYENIKVTNNAWDSNLIKSNGKYISVNWDASGGGAFAVIPLSEVGKAQDKVPLFRGHTAAVLDTDWSPFNDSELVSSSDDGKIALWNIPEGYSFKNFTDSDGNIKDITQPVKVLSGHTRKVGHVQYHPIAENVLASSSLDYTIKIWNLETGKDVITLKHTDLVTSFSFNYNGSLLATTSRDKKLRVWDIRSGKVVSEGPGHTGAKASRVAWLGNSDRLATTGFSRLSDRQIGVWNATDIAAGPIGGFYNVDSSAGVLMPFFDDATKILFVAGKGDGNIRYYEFADDELFPLSEFQSTDPQRGFAIAPKRFCNVQENEIVKAFKTVRDNAVEPISFIVPRRAEMFQDDIYPDAPSSTPALSAEEWFAGKDVAGPVLLSMKDIYEGNEPTLSESKPPVEKPKEEPKEEPKKEDPKPEPKKEEPKAAAPEPVAPAFVKSQEKGVDELLNKKEVNSLLDKVNNLSDDEAPKDSASENWDDDEDYQEAKKVVVEETPEPAKEEPKPEPKAASPEPVKAVTPEPVKEEPKPEPVKEVEPTKSEPKSEPKAEPKAEPASAPAAKAAAGATTLKGTVERLASLVDKLESTIEALTQANLDKDERLASLETKLETLCKK